MATRLIAGHFHVVLLTSLVYVWVSLDPAIAPAQDVGDDTPAAAAAAEQPDANPAEQVAEKDPFSVPENASAKELFEFIDSVKRLRGRTTQSTMKAARAAVDGAEAIRNLEGVELEDEIEAIREELSALSFLSRMDRKSAAQMKALIASLKHDGRAEIVEIAAIESFKLRIDSARSATADEQLQMIDELKELISGREFDRQAYSLAFALASAIGYSKSSKVAASLYEDMSAMMSQSKDESLRDRAPKMMGAAKRMRLPGNFMEVMGQTTDGTAFEWDRYRGKVVLVDFWASWCGPCRGEVPNMKRNLAAYENRGFAIVGVNLDRTLAACNKYVEQEELTWINLMSDKDGERGWDNPLAVHYGISAIPTAILVNQAGHVVSLRARGTELDRLLAEMLGAPEPREDESQEKADAKTAEKTAASDR